MIQNAAETAPQHDIERALRAELARGDAVAGSVLPILRHLLASSAPDLFNEDLLARIRGMAENLAAQLLELRAGLTASDNEPAAIRQGLHEASVEGLANALLAKPGLLSHLHALALEWRLTERLEARLALDPVMSPLLHSMMGAAETSVPDIAMRFLGAQARFCQSQRQMKLPIGELPIARVEDALNALRGLALDGAVTEIRVARIEAEIFARHDHSHGRQELSARLLLAGSGRTDSTLSISQAGVALFLTALALGSGQSRDVLTLATHESQSARLLLSLRAAGLGAAKIVEQFRMLHPGKMLPMGSIELDPEQATELLNGVSADMHPPET